MASACEEGSRGQRSTKQLQGTARCVLQAEKTTQQKCGPALEALEECSVFENPHFSSGISFFFFLEFLFKLELEVNISTAGRDT